MICSYCKKDKDISCFSNNKSRKTGKNTMCRECFKQYNANYSPQKRRARGIRRAYGLGWDIYTRMYQEQNGKCAICNKDIKLIGLMNIKDGAHVDHDHKTDKIRGLLCSNCNSGIGHLQDSMELLQKAILYLEYFKRHG